MIDFLQASTNLLCLYAVTAIVFFTVFASLMFDTVFPEIDIKYRFLFFASFLFFNKSRGSKALALKSENTSASCADTKESPVPQKIVCFCVGIESCFCETKS